MKRTLWLLACLGALLLSAAPVPADDGFYVIAAGQPSVGTKITSLPYTISTPGYYYLTGNLSMAAAPASPSMPTTSPWTSWVLPSSVPPITVTSA